MRFLTNEVDISKTVTKTSRQCQWREVNVSNDWLFSYRQGGCDQVLDEIALSCMHAKPASSYYDESCGGANGLWRSISNLSNALNRSAFAQVHFIITILN